MSDGECCWRDHARATPPWTCPCECHRRKQADEDTTSLLTPEVLEAVISILQTHQDGEGHWCDTGADMEWACRSECVEAAIRRLREACRG